jgi:hypothetical protein
MKKDKKQALATDRRKFLRGSLVTGVGVAAAAVLPGTVLAVESDVATKEEGQKGYHLTQHILDYYKTMAS